MKAQGVKIKFTDKNMAYGPNPSGGGPGIILIPEDASITALMHEAKHFYDDLEKGFPGMKGMIENAQVRWQLEYDAYMEEINFLRKHREFEAAQEILENALEEKRAIEKLYNIKL